MATIKFHINTTNHIIMLSNIKMNQNNFSYNNVTFTKVDDNNIRVKYKKQTTEDNQDGKDCNLTWGLNSIMKVLSEYSKEGCNHYDENYKMFEFEF